MLKPAKKPGLLIAIGSAKPKPGGDEEGSSEDMASEGGSLFKEHASDVYDALKSGDKEGFVSALESAIEACKGEGYGSDEE